MSISEKLIKSPHRGKWNGEDLILNKDRVNDFGEVLTPPNIVSDMLDLGKGSGPMNHGYLIK